MVIGVAWLELDWRGVITFDLEFDGEKEKDSNNSNGNYEWA